MDHSIDLYNDFNDELDARAGDSDDDGGVQRNSDDDNQNNAGSDGEQRQEVQPKIKVVKAKRQMNTLNVLKLKGPRGIIAIDESFENIKFKGKGYEKEDLDSVMKRLEHWAHRMYPKYKFDDSLAAIEKLGKKKEMAIHMTRYRLGQLTKDEDVIIQSDEEDDVAAPREDEPMDEFEALIDEQIALSTVNQSRTAHDKSFGNISGIFSSTKVQDRSFGASQSHSQPKSQHQPSSQAKSQYQPASQSLTPSQPSQLSKTQVPAQPVDGTDKPELSSDVRAKIAENRMRAMAIQAQRRQEAEEKARQAAEENARKAAEEEKIRKEQEESRKRIPEISNILIDDDF